MKKLFIVVVLAVAVLAVSPCAFAEKGKPGMEKASKVKGEAVEKSGVVEVKAKEKGEKYDTITLKVGTEVFKLLPGKGMKGKFDGITKLAGKEVTVKGELLAANDKHPMAAIKVESFAEKGAAAAPADAKPADAKPADAKPADAKPADAKPADEKPAEGK